MAARDRADQSIALRELLGARSDAPFDLVDPWRSPCRSSALQRRVLWLLVWEGGEFRG
jgi:hypothetical protein